MHPQAAAEATKVPPGAPKGSEERFWAAQRASKTRQIWSLKPVKIETRFWSDLGVDFGAFGGPKTWSFEAQQAGKKARQ